jgi:N-methylhydantoinase B
MSGESTDANDPMSHFVVDDNVVRRADGTYHCVHCDTLLGDRSGTYLEKALRRESPPEKAGPQIRAPAGEFIDAPVVMRQMLCPGCYVALHTEIVPASEPARRDRQFS